MQNDWKESERNEEFQVLEQLINGIEYGPGFLNQKQKVALLTTNSIKNVHSESI